MVCAGEHDDGRDDRDESEGEREDRCERDAIERESMIRAENRERTLELLSIGMLHLKADNDIKEAAKLLSRPQALWNVSLYYLLQDLRIRAAAQGRELLKDAEPDSLVKWIFGATAKIESSIKPVLGEFAGAYRVGAWMQSLHGIGPILSAALISHFDIRRAPTVGAMWRYCGLDPSCIWLGKKKAIALVKELGIEDTLSPMQAALIQERCGQKPEKLLDVFNSGVRHQKKLWKGKAGLIAFLSKRPWNAELKAIVAFRLGECFVKLQNNDKCFYGKLFAQKKAALWLQNVNGEFQDAATKGLEILKNKTTATWKWKNGQMSPARVRQALAMSGAKTSQALATMKPVQRGGVPMLPPGQIHDRARRWTVKLFLSHLHHVMHQDYYGRDPVAPFIFAHPAPGQHAHKIEVPNWPADHAGRNLRELAD